MASISGRKFAVLATDGVEQVELTEPVRALKQAHAHVVVVSPQAGEIQGMNHAEKGDRLPVDQALDQASPAAFDGLVLPGGVANPDYLRVNPQAVAFVQHFVQSGKPIAAICHGPWTLIEAGAVRGRKMTSYESIQTDLKNAGANWVDQEVASDQGIVTSRKPDDIPSFNLKMIEEFAEGAHDRQRTVGSGR